jgi:hypothetical protein
MSDWLLDFGILVFGVKVFTSTDQFLPREPKAKSSLLVYFYDDFSTTVTSKLR